MRTYFSNCELSTSSWNRRRLVLFCFHISRNSRVHSKMLGTTYVHSCEVIGQVSQHVTSNRSKSFRKLAISLRHSLSKNDCAAENMLRWVQLGTRTGNWHVTGWYPSLSRENFQFHFAFLQMFTISITAFHRNAVSGERHHHQRDHTLLLYFSISLIDYAQFVPARISFSCFAFHDLFYSIIFLLRRNY